MIKQKKGVSVMIGYVLLVSLAVIMGIIVFNYLKTFVWTEKLECPDGVSLYMGEYSCSLTSKQLNITLRNSGRFDIAGYFIKGTTTSGASIATTNLAEYFDEEATGLGPLNMGNAILATSSPGNLFQAGSDTFAVFNIGSLELKLLEITPFRYEEQKDGRTRLVSCNDAVIRERITCSP